MEGSKSHPPWGIWFQGTSLHVACVCGEQSLCVCYKQLAKTHSVTAATPLTQLRGWLSCGDTESNWNLSPNTAPKLGNFSATWRAVRKSTPVNQGQGAQPQPKQLQDVLGSGNRYNMACPEKLRYAPFSQHKRCVGRQAPFSQGISTCHSAVSFVPTVWNQVDFTQRSGETDFTTLWLTLNREKWEQQSFMTHYIV